MQKSREEKKFKEKKIESPEGKITNRKEAIVFGVELHIQSTNNWYWTKFLLESSISLESDATFRSSFNFFFLLLLSSLVSFAFLHIWRLKYVWTKRYSSIHSSKFIEWDVFFKMHPRTHHHFHIDWNREREQKKNVSNWLPSY